MNVDVRHYCIHGMRLSVTCEAASLIECVDAVLRPFAVPELKGAAFTFRMRLGTPSDRTPGALRQIWSGTLPGGLFSVYWAGDDLRQIDLPGIAQLRMDLARRQATLTVKPGAERYVEYGCITPMVYTFLRQVGQHVVHAASLSVRVGRRRRAVMLSGLSGLGKTTTAIAL
ncbi:MAG: hypothetical protein QGD94_09285, partial [Planctomycetia bacterium]|nr:hypothetical protein [Planctomycetia bacterium]